jgi:riboflavin-specific deaminase-like protein
VILSYAQSVEGSIAGPCRERVRLSGPESMQLTYAVRALCDTILVGIGTILADNPRLTLKNSPGTPPQPIVLDTHLRMPPDAALIRRTDRRPWLVHGPDAAPGRARELAAAGAEPRPAEIGPDGWIDLERLMGQLAMRSIDSLMVEGGARVLTSFLRARLADVVIITISPQILGGLPVIDRPGPGAIPAVDFGAPAYQTFGRDLVIWARPEWKTA